MAKDSVKKSSVYQRKWRESKKNDPVWKQKQQKQNAKNYRNRIKK